MKKSRTPPVCRWTPDGDSYGESWDTSCGEKFEFIEGGPKENGMRYCPYCGKPLRENRAQP